MTPDIPVLETPRLRLRALVEGDLDALHAIGADPETARYIGDGSPLDARGAWRFIAVNMGHWCMRGFGQWAVEERASGAMIGRLGMWEPYGWPDLEIGWMIARDRWGRGYATEGSAAALDWAFATLRPARVISLILPENVASVRVAEKIGESLAGEHELFGQTVSVYAVTRADREARAARP
jgi:RimJ/RimL family protein N-acetyltransferase